MNTTTVISMSAILSAESKFCNDFYITTGQTHYSQLHDQPDGLVLLWQPNEAKGRWRKLVPGHATVPSLLAEQLDQPDRYISVNEFYAWRIVAHLKSLRACFADIDGCIDVDWCLQCVAAAGIPSPTFIIRSGRGVHLYWQIDPVPAKALAVWQQVQDTILAELKKQGLPVDMKARDCTRVLRLAGSVNSKNGAKVTGYVITDWQWDLHTLADEVLGHRLLEANEEKKQKALEYDQQRDASSAKIRDFRAAQIRNGIKPKTVPNGVKKGSIYQWWQLVYQDLITIGDQLGGIKKGHRDTYLFLYAVALSWFSSPESLESEVVLVARKVMPEFKVKEVQKAIQPNLARVHKFLNGEKVTWNGQERDPRYWFKRQTLFDLLGEIIHKDMYLSLRAILPAGVIQQRKAETDKKRVTRPERYSDMNTKAGIRASNLVKAAQAKELKANGIPIDDILKQLQISRATFYRLLKQK